MIWSFIIICFVSVTAVVSAQEGNENAAVHEKLKVPTGTPHELHSYMSELRSLALKKINSTEEYYDFMKKKTVSTIEAADKILNHTESTVEHKASAIKDKISAYYTSMRLGEKAEEAAAEIHKLVEKVKSEDIYADIRNEANSLHLSARLLQIQQGLGKAERNVKEEYETLHKDICDYFAKNKLDDKFTGLTHTMLETGSKIYEKGADYGRKAESLIADYKKFLPEGKHAKLEGVGRRATLITNSMELEAVSIDVKKLAADYSKLDDPAKFDAEAWLKNNPTKNFKLDSLKGKVVLVDFWATWCKDCMVEVPNLLALYDKYHGKGFEIVAYSTDQNIPALLKYLGKENPPWIVCSAQLSKEVIPTNYSDLYGINYLPTMFLIGQDGKVLYIETHGNELGEQLEKLFSE